MSTLEQQLQKALDQLLKESTIVTPRVTVQRNTETIDISVTIPTRGIREHDLSTIESEARDIITEALTPIINEGIVRDVTSRIKKRNAQQGRFYDEVTGSWVNSSRKPQYIVMVYRNGDWKTHSHHETYESADETYSKLTAKGVEATVVDL